MRYLLSKLHFSLSTGYSATNYNHTLDGRGIIQAPGLPPNLFSGNVTSRYGNWTTDVWPGDTVTTGAFVVSSDTADLGFSSSTFTIPIKGTVHIEFGRYRVGGGYEYGFTRVGAFRPISYAGNISEYTIPQRSFFMKHYFGMIGAMIYRFNEYTFVVDANIGGYKLGKQFNQNVIQRSLYFNFGTTIEREFSEYFRLFVRPSYEIKGYKLTLPEGGSQINHRLNAIYVNIGLTYRLPELRR
ncbi:MAG TPA: hypothetical protein VEB86_04675, partial [Chryseosolibacter sp.]|nr:hypothetical protein [Chryseosolibacter sp.]